MKVAVAAWPFKSSKGTTNYETILYSDGSTSCDCPGWVYFYGGKKGAIRKEEKVPLYCTHTKDVHQYALSIASRSTTIERTGGRVLTSGGNAAVAAAQAEPITTSTLVRKAPAPPTKQQQAGVLENVILRASRKIVFEEE